MLLTEEELKELTGRKQKSKIKEWLQSKGIDFMTDADDFPKVSKELIQEMLKGNVQFKPAQRKRGNADALRELMGQK